MENIPWDEEWEENQIEDAIETWNYSYLLEDEVAMRTNIKLKSFLPF